MITATVRYKLPPHIDCAACREHFHKIAPGFREVKGLISKHFIWSESGWAGGVYQWQTLELYPFRFRDPLTGKWVRARHKLQYPELQRRYAEWEITGRPEIRDRTASVEPFNPFRPTQRVCIAPMLLWMR